MDSRRKRAIQKKYMDYLSICTSLATMGFGLLALIFYLLDYETASPFFIELGVSMGLLLLTISIPMIIPLIMFYFTPPKNVKTADNFLKLWLMVILISVLVVSLYNQSWMLVIGAFVVAIAVGVQAFHH
jgi:hypothetical protein